jgi:hypothetical protein
MTSEQTVSQNVDRKVSKCEKQSFTIPNVSSAYSPFNHIASLSKSFDAITVVVVLSCSWFKEALKLEFTGRMSFSSLFPQYLTTAMLTGALQVAMIGSMLQTQLVE